MADCNDDQVVPEFSFPVFCECRREDGRSVPVVERTCWKVSNPGRRYWSCRNNMTSDRSKKKCAMFLWKDGELNPHYRNVMNSLIEEIKGFQQRLSYYVPISSIVDLEDEIEALNVEKTFLIRYKEKLCKKVGDLEAIIADERAKMKTELYWCKLVCVALVIAFFAISVSGSLGMRSLKFFVEMDGCSV